MILRFSEPVVIVDKSRIILNFHEENGNVINVTVRDCNIDYSEAFGSTIKVSKLGDTILQMLSSRSFEKYLSVLSDAVMDMALVPNFMTVLFKKKQGHPG